MERASWDHPCVVLDVDGTLCPTRQEDQDYADLLPYTHIVAKLWEYRAQGYYLILQTGRQVRTFENNIGRINAITLPTLVAWLQAHDIPFDEIYVGRPWPGAHGFYVCDQTVTPKLFLAKTPEEILKWLDSQRP